MHVREVPYIIFKEFAGDGQQYDVHQFARECHPPYPERDIKEDFPNTIRTVGISSEGFGLRLRGHLPDENLPMTFLELFRSLQEAVLGDRPPASIVAGNRDAGVWAYGRGNKTEQTVWMRVGENRTNSLEDLERAARFHCFLGEVTRRAYEISSSGQFEHSEFYDGDIDSS